MARECMRQCPRIQEILDDIESDVLISGPMAFHFDMLRSEEDTGATRLLEACSDTYDCAGPKLKKVLVQRGLFRKRQEAETEIVCGLDS